MPDPTPHTHTHTGPIFGLPSGALLHTTLSHWLSVPPTYDGLLLETKKKGGALKKKAADIKIGPLLHATGQHFDGDRVKVGVQVGGLLLTVSAQRLLTAGCAGNRQNTYRVSPQAVLQELNLFHDPTCLTLTYVPTTQAVVKEGTGGSALLVVKLTVEQPSKGNPNFARRLLGLPDLTPAPNRYVQGCGVCHSGSWEAAVCWHALKTGKPD